MWYVPLKDTMLYLEKLSPISVEFTNEMMPGYNGFYSHCGDFDFDINHHIEINDNLPDYKKIGVLAHEIGHAMCDKENCDCMKNPNRKYREIHAYTYELEWLLKHKQKKGLKWVINKLAYWAKYDSGCYAGAAKHITKTELWQKCLDYVK
jgi:hypothetical protein